MALGMRLQRSAALAGSSGQTRTPLRVCSSIRSRSVVVVRAQLAEQDAGSKTIVVKSGQGDLPLPWSERDPYRLPVSIDRVQRLLMSYKWEKPWVEQIIDRMMKGTLRTTEERTVGVIDYLISVGLRSDEVCNMASISMVLLGLNPETRLKTVVAYMMQRGVPAEAVPDILLKHPRIFEYKVTEGSASLTKGMARIQVDVIPTPSGSTAIGVNYFRVGASFLVSPVSPAPPMPMMQ